MSQAEELLENITSQCQGEFRDRKTILTFSGFLEQVAANPRGMVRSSAQYLKDAFNHFGSEDRSDDPRYPKRYKLFDEGTDRGMPIIGSEAVQNEIYRVISTFVRQGYSNKLIVLHGPNGSAKTSIIECITRAISLYSAEEQGAIYKFNWIFPTDKSDQPRTYGETGPLGFGNHRQREITRHSHSYAQLEEQKIAAKVDSEFRENPLFLIPTDQRVKWLKQIIADKEGKAPEDIELPPHIMLAGLSKRNQEIFNQLLNAYNGDFSMVQRHIQVERFFYSKQYRVGFSTVEPQMSIDAAEKQLTMDRSISNLPSVLHNISFHQAIGPLVEANRGILEYSDLLKRPVEAFKYLLTTVERGTINLSTSMTHLDTVFFATTNEKHLDAFKTMPDFASFRSRFALITVPYLLRARDEVKIYERDYEVLKQSKPVAPHTMKLLAIWAVLTRLKQPNPELYESKHRSLVARLDPVSKARLYDGESLSPHFKSHEETTLKDLRRLIISESDGNVVYEGRFGASPREIRSILYRAVQNSDHKTLTPMTIFEELDYIVKDRSVYEFLQLEPRGKYHQPHAYIENLRDIFAEIFEHEATMAMELVADGEYEKLLTRYVQNVVAAVKKEKIYNDNTSTYELPSADLMRRVEEIIKITGSVERHRESLLGKVAAYRIDNPGKNLVITDVFSDYLKAIQDFYHDERQVLVSKTFKAMLARGTDNESSFYEEERQAADTTFKNLISKYGYDEDSVRACLKFLISRRKDA